ncbi:hypothetical protein KY284_007588 [Solanum tuberosum]|nr:hypothetical protein KY284_007588 [Solanum tuberosum]
MTWGLGVMYLLMISSHFTSLNHIQEQQINNNEIPGIENVAISKESSTAETLVEPINDDRATATPVAVLRRYLVKQNYTMLDVNHFNQAVFHTLIELRNYAEVSKDQIWIEAMSLEIKALEENSASSKGKNCYKFKMANGCTR